MFPSASVPAVASTSIADLHSDIIHTHILTRLDGPALASVSCASSELHSLSEEETLWTNICYSTWPSTSHPLMTQLFSDISNGHRSLFADSYPVPFSIPKLSSENLHHQSPTEIISAVDIHYKEKLIFSKVQQTETRSRLFQCSPFRIDCLQPENVSHTQVQVKTASWKNLMEDLRLSWIVVIGQRAANLSSCSPVSVDQNQLTKDVSVKFATILSIDQESDVMCEIVVTFEGDMELCEVSMHVEDMDGINLNGHNTLEIFQNAIEWGRRRKCSAQERLEMHGEYASRKERLRKQRTLPMLLAYLPTIFHKWFVY